MEPTTLSQSSWMNLQISHELFVQVTGALLAKSETRLAFPDTCPRIARYVPTALRKVARRAEVENSPL